MSIRLANLKKLSLKTGFLFLVLLEACARPTFRIIDKPVTFNAQRKKLSIEYMEKRYGMHTDSPYIHPQMIVLHWTAVPTLEQSFDGMNPAVLPGSRTAIASASSLNVASQFLIDRDGTIFRQLPDTAFARHVIGLNYCAIGVENVGSDKAPLTHAQLKSNELLIRYLKHRYNIQYLIGHYEYKRFIGHPLWREKDPDYLTGKIDPGKTFMKKIRRRTRDLGLKGAP